MQVQVPDDLLVTQGQKTNYNQNRSVKYQILVHYCIECKHSDLNQRLDVYAKHACTLAVLDQPTAEDTRSKYIFYQKTLTYVLHTLPNPA